MIWQGALTGGIVAGLNHELHGEGNEPPKKGLFSKSISSKNLSGEKFNFFDGNSTDPGERALFNFANLTWTESNTIKWFAHGNINRTAGMTASEVHNYLSKISKLYQASLFGLKVNLELNSCTTGNMFYGNAIAFELSKLNPYINITAPSAYISRIGIETHGFYYTFKNGNYSYSLKNFSLTNQKMSYDAKGNKYNWKF